MRDWDDIFRMIDEIMNSSYTGGFKFRDDSDDDVYNYSDKGIDIQVDDKHIYITAEIRVPDEDIDVTPHEYNLTMQFMKDGAWRKRIIQLPKRVNPKTAKISFNNCILDVSLEIVEEEEIENE